MSITGVRAREYGRNFDPQLTLQENWDAAELLNDGWWLYCTHEERERYRNCDSNIGAMAHEEAMIKHTIIDQLYAGIFIALGIPTGQSEVQIIPKNAFRPRAAKVDWVENRVFGLGLTYENVAVCYGATAHSATNAADVREEAASIVRGRKRLDRMFDEALSQCREEIDNFDNMSREKKAEALREKVKQQNPGMYPNKARPGRSTAYRYLQKIK